MAGYGKTFVTAKIDPLFKQKIEEVAIERVKKGLDKRMTAEQRAIRRYTKAMTRFSPLWEALKSSEFKEDTK